MDKAGYSVTPLAKKLGIKSNYIVQVFNSPKPYLDFFHEFPENINIVDMDTIIQADIIHLFVRTQNELKNLFSLAKSNLKKDGALWVSWPKKISKIHSDLDKFFVLNYGLTNGLVDVKVAAIDIDWSGHKFVYRLNDRS